MKFIKPVFIATLLFALLTNCTKSNPTPDSSDPGGTTPPPVTNNPPPPNYTNVKITAVTVTSLPATKSNGGGWQSNGGPNVYFKIIDPNGNVLVTGATVNDVVALPIQWTFTQAFEITNLNTQYEIDFYNHNAVLQDDDMGGYKFVMNGFKSGYPSSVVLSQTGYPITLTFTTSWY